MHVHMYTVQSCKTPGPRDLRFLNQSFSLRFLLHFFFFIKAVYGGCEDDLHISSQQIDGRADTFISCN